MNRSELVHAFAEHHGLAVPQARAYLDTVLLCITRALAAGQKVTLDGFGVFGLRQRSPRTTVNPATGQPMRIDAADVPTFRASPRLRKAVNEPRVFV